MALAGRGGGGVGVARWGWADCGCGVCWAGGVAWWMGVALQLVGPRLGEGVAPPLSGARLCTWAERGVAGE